MDLIAIVDDSGTAIADTAICPVHDTVERRLKLWLDAQHIEHARPPHAWADASGNDQLWCVGCDEPQWPAEDQAAAAQDGWDIFECNDSAHEPFELQRIDFPDAWDLPFEDPVFDDDISAWRHVVAKAAEGSPLHNRALRFLAAHSPGEVVHISTWLAQGRSDSCPCTPCTRRAAS